MKKKYELLKDDTIDVYGFVLHRIRALRDFGNVKKGDLGGYIEKEENLSRDGDCWVFDEAKVYGDAKVVERAWIRHNAQVSNNAWVGYNATVTDNANVSGNARVSGGAQVSDNAQIYGFAQVAGYAKVYDDAWICNNAYIHSTNDYICIGPIGSRNDYTTFYLTKDKNIMVKCGCFNDTLEEFIKAINETHKDNEKYKKQYLGIIEYVKSIL